MSRRDPYWRSGYQLRWNEVATTLARFDADAGLAVFRKMTPQEIGRRQRIAHEQAARASRAGDYARADELRRMAEALAVAMREVRGY